MVFGKYGVIAKKKGERDKVLFVSHYYEVVGWMEDMKPYLGNGYEYWIEKLKDYSEEEKENDNIK